MGLSKKTIEGFKQIYSQEFEEEISDEQAKELRENLLNLFKIIYRFISKSKEEGREK